MFSRDAVSERLNEVIKTSNERSQALILITSLNLTLGVAFLLSTLFSSGVWGSAITFQATTTSLVHLLICYLIFQWLKQPDMQKLDVLGGSFLMLLLMLLQTSMIWGNLASGFIGTPSPCLVAGTGGDRATSAFAGILFVTNMAFASLAFSWRKDWLEGSSSGGGGMIHGGYENLASMNRNNSSILQESNVVKSTFNQDAEGAL